MFENTVTLLVLLEDTHALLARLSPDALVGVLRYQFPSVQSRIHLHEALLETGDNTLCITSDLRNLIPQLLVHTRAVDRVALKQ